MQVTSFLCKYTETGAHYYTQRQNKKLRSKHVPTCAILAS